MEGLPLSHQEATSFVEDFLGLDNISGVIRQRPRDALDMIAKNFSFKVPFQNVSLLTDSVDKTSRPPTFEKIKANITSGRGGMNYDNNLFLCAVLHRLGFDSCLGAAAVNTQDDHAIVLVRGVAGETAMLDVGHCLPQLQAITLSFGGGSSVVYSNGSIIYRFVNHDGVLHRQVATRGAYFLCPSSFDVTDESNSTVEWKTLFTFSAREVSLDYFETALQTIYAEYYLARLLVVKVEEDAICKLEDCEKNHMELDVKYRFVKPGGSTFERLRTQSDVVDYLNMLLPHFTEEEMHSAVEAMLYHKQRKTCSGVQPRK